MAQSLDRSFEHGRPRNTDRDDISPAWSATDSGVGGRATGRDTFAIGGGQDTTDFTRSVSQRRPAEGLRPLGGRVGAFVVRPSLDVREIYDNNIFATETDTEDDFLTTVRPGLSIRSDWGRHSLGLTANAEIGRHATITAEDYEDFFFGADGRLDIRQGTSLLLNGSYERGHIGRSSPDDTTGSAEPRLYQRAIGYVGLARALGLITATLDTTVTWTDFEDSETGTGVIIDNDTDNNLVLTPGFRVGYNPAPGSEVYFRGRYVDVTYPDQEAGGIDRDNEGVDAIVGATKVFDDVWNGEVYVGYAPRYFEDAALKDIQGLTGIVGGLNVMWNPSALTSGIMNVSHATSATTTSGASAIAATEVGLTLEQELSQDIMVDASVGYTNADYVGSSRLDKTFVAGLGAEYLVNRWVSVSLGYDFTTRDSTNAGSSYDKHAVGLGLRLQY